MDLATHNFVADLKMAFMAVKGTEIGCGMNDS